MSIYRPEAESTAAMFFTKYSDPTEFTHEERKRFRSTFQASKLGDQNKMNEIQDMFNNYNLFKYGQGISGAKKRYSVRGITVDSNPQKNKNMRERLRENEHLKQRLQKMKSQRRELFSKLEDIVSKNVKN